LLTQLQNSVHAQLLNTDIRGKGVLNFKCGADFVKVDQKIPSGLTVEQSKGKCASLDGDADRVVYYYTNSDGKFTLLDGDKIAALAAGFIKEQFAALTGLDVKVGVVQTAYANGASTKYFESKGIPVTCTETGVKHLHHAAEEYDIGVYFEANGHGTVLFKSEVLDKLHAFKASNEEQKKAIGYLIGLSEVINQAVGDAISDLLMVEAILTLRNWNLDDWTKVYKDLANRQLKVKVKDRSAFKTTNADRQLVEPAVLQPLIDSLVKKYNSGRAFVRPSGTEDVVRVYAEAETQDAADELAYLIACEVFDKAGGVGDRPVKK